MFLTPLRAGEEAWVSPLSEREGSMGLVLTKAGNKPWASPLLELKRRDGLGAHLNREKSNACPLLELEREAWAGPLLEGETMHGVNHAWISGERLGIGPSWSGSGRRDWEFLPAGNEILEWSRHLLTLKRIPRLRSILGRERRSGLHPLKKREGRPSLDLLEERGGRRGSPPCGRGIAGVVLLCSERRSMGSTTPGA